MKNAILFGNGLNRAGGNSLSWENLLESLSSLKKMPSDSNTLNYECIYLNACKDDSCETKAGLVNEFSIKQQIADMCQRFEPNKFYEMLMHLPSDIFLTTNYDETLGKTLEEHGYIREKRLDSVSESIYSIRRSHAYRNINTEKIKRIFPIHGECLSPKTIMIGYDQYCGSLGKLDDYFKGKYVYKMGEETKKLPRLLERLRENEKRVLSNDLGNYWPDYFFTHDIHMIGIGMPLVESDLWWVLNKRCRYKKVCPEITNTIYFYGTQYDKVVSLLESFDVKVIVTEVNDNDWSTAYMKMFDQMERNIK